MNITCVEFVVRQILLICHHFDSSQALCNVHAHTWERKIDKFTCFLARFIDAHLHMCYWQIVTCNANEYIDASSSFGLTISPFQTHDRPFHNFNLLTQAYFDINIEVSFTMKMEISNYLKKIYASCIWAALVEFLTEFFHKPSNLLPEQVLRQSFMVENCVWMRRSVANWFWKKSKGNHSTHFPYMCIVRNSVKTSEILNSKSPNVIYSHFICLKRFTIHFIQSSCWSNCSFSFIRHRIVLCLWIKLWNEIA